MLIVEPLDKLKMYAKKHNVNLITGHHCYSFFSGTETLIKIQNQELGTFYLTDYLVRHFDNLIIKAYKLDKNTRNEKCYLIIIKRLYILHKQTIIL